MRKITISKATELIEGRFLVQPHEDNATVENGYCGDFLSHVISRVPDNAIWFTIMNNANVAAVAQLGDVKAVVVCEGVKAEERLIECCKNEKIALIQTNLTSFECALRLGEDKNADESLL